MPPWQGIEAQSAMLAPDPDGMFARDDAAVELGRRRIVLALFGPNNRCADGGLVGARRAPK
ncbi:MAG: hypothetical protein WDN03_13590 [Rhizomicrobium sp.]